MAVPEQTPYSEYTGNGVTKSFALNFDCESKDHLIVLVDEIEPPIATWSLSAGNVVFTTAPASGSKITLQRNTPFGRTTDYQSFNNSFRPQTVNGDFDRLWLKLQELGVADWLMKLYVDRLHQQQEVKINDLKSYVDDRDDELQAYLMEEIRKQGVALDQLDDYYNYLMQRLAQIAVDRGWMAEFVINESGNTQQSVNDLGGVDYWHEKKFGYRLYGEARLLTGDIVKSTVAENSANPNIDMTGWVKVNSASQIFDSAGESLQALSDSYHKYIANVLNFGAKPIPGFDNRDAFEAAGAWLESKGGGTLYIPDGVFEFYSVFGTNNCCIKPRSNITYVGNFGRRSCLKFGDGLNSDKSYGCTFIFPPENSDSTELDNVKVRGICFDHNGSNNIMTQPPSSYPFTTAGQAVGIQHGDDIVVENNTFLNNPGRQTVMLGKNQTIHTIGKSTIRFNAFINCGKSVTGNSSQTDHSSIYSMCEDSDVYGNLFFNQTKDGISTAIELHGTRPKAWGNTIYNYGQAFNLAATVVDMSLGTFRENYVEGCAHIGTLWGFAGLSLSTLIKDNTFVIDIANQAQINGITNIQAGIVKNSHIVDDNTIIYTGSYTDADYASFIDIAHLTKLSFKRNEFPEGYSGRAVNISSVKSNATITLKGNDLLGVAGTSRTGYEECFWINSGLTTNIKQLIITDNTAIDCDKYLYTIPNVAATISSLVEKGNTISKNMVDVANVGAAVVLGARAAIVDRISNRINARASQGSRVFDTSTGKRYVKATNNETSVGWVEEFTSIAVGSATWASSTLNAGATRSTTISVSNAITANSIINYSFGAPLQGTFISAEYQDATTIKLSQYNPTSGSLTFSNTVATVQVSG